MEEDTIREVAKTTGTAIEAGRELGGYVARMLGDLPEDAVGLAVGDWVKELRIRNKARLEQNTTRILEERGVKTPEAPSLVVAVPLVQAAQDETREELLELWARLLATVMDPGRNVRVRQSYIDALKRLDPPDAFVLRVLYSRADLTWDKPDLAKAAGGHGVSEDELHLSLANLSETGLVRLIRQRGGVTGDPLEANRVQMSALGRSLLKALAD